MDEEWSKIAGFPRYEISSEGRVRVHETGLYLSPTLNQHGHPKVNLRRNSERVTKSVGGLVARAYLETPPRRDYTSLIHLDGDVTNCRADNLQWRPRHFALKYHKQFDTSLWRRASMPVVDMETEEHYLSVQDAAVRNGLLAKDIIVSSYARTYTWPTFQRFQLLDE